MIVRQNFPFVGSPTSQILKIPDVKYAKTKKTAFKTVGPFYRTKRTSQNRLSSFAV